MEVTRVVLSVSSAAAVLASFGDAGAREEEIQGEIGAGVSVGVQHESALVGGDARLGMYATRERATPMLVGNRIGFDGHLRVSYGRGSDGALIGNLLAGVAPSFTHQFAGTERYRTGLRLTTVTGLVLPEPGIWIRSDGPLLFYLGWRAQMTWLPESEAGLELVPSFVWAPSGSWMGTLSVGGFLR